MIGVKASQVAIRRLGVSGVILASDMVPGGPGRMRWTFNISLFGHISAGFHSRQIVICVVLQSIPAQEHGTCTIFADLLPERRASGTQTFDSIFKFGSPSICPAFRLGDGTSHGSRSEWLLDVIEPGAGHGDGISSTSVPSPHIVAIRDGFTL